MIVDRTRWIIQPNDKTSIKYKLDPQLNIPLYVQTTTFSFLFFKLINLIVIEIHLVVRVSEVVVLLLDGDQINV